MTKTPLPPTTIESFATRMNISVDELITKLGQAGIAGKQKDDWLADDEKVQLLQFLNNATSGEDMGSRISVKRKTTDKIRQTSRTGAARTVHVERKKRRTFVKRSTLAAEQAEVVEREAQAEQERVAAEQLAQAKLAAEQAETTIEPIEPTASEAVDSTPTEPTPESSDSAVSTPTAQPKKPTRAKPAALETKKTTAGGERSDKGKKTAKGKRARGGDGNSGGRAQLHAAKRRKGQSFRQVQRKHGKISSSTADQHVFARPTAPVVHQVWLPETISVGELAQAMSIKAGTVIKCMMEMGSLVTINQLLDRDTATLVVEEMGHVAKMAVDSDPELVLVKRDESTQLSPRPPVVTVMGHVDHGKTSLLDYLRKSKVAAGEAGGITQHIGAYKVNINGKEICFLDTPGHAAFSAMRARGAKATDIVILVVAADDGVMPQTVEAIKHAQAAQVPLVVAINKIDREQADVEKVMQALSAQEVVPEAWGGEVLMNPLSALSGEGVDALLESVLLVAEVADLRAAPSGAAQGVVIEAKLDKGRGPVASVLVQQGVLQQGDIVLVGQEVGKVRAMSDDLGRAITAAGPSTPVEIQGLAGVPAAGDDLVVVADERKAREIALRRHGKSKELKLAQQQKTKFEGLFTRLDDDSKTLNILLKTDVQGSVEALCESLITLSMDGVTVNVVHGMVGGINESDVNLAMAAGAIIIGFNVRADALARKLIEAEGLTVYYHNIIYDVVDSIKAIMTGLLSPVEKEKIVGLVEVREVFRAPKIGSIAGCLVSEGSVKRNLPVRVLRDSVVIFEGKIDSLRRFKEDVSEVKNGYECGIGIKNYDDIKVGDQIEVFEIIISERQLA